MAEMTSSELLQDRLVRKMDDEFERLNRWMNRLSKMTILQHAMEYATKKEILDTVRICPLDEDSSKSLIRMNEPLESVFQSYMCRLDRGQDAILDTIRTISGRKPE